MAIELNDLPKYTGSRVKGIAPKLFLIPAQHIDAFPGPPVSPGPGESFLMDGAITVVDELTQGFVEFELTLKSAKLLMELMGQKDSKDFDVKLEFFRPGIDWPFMEKLIEDLDYVAIAQTPDCTNNQRIVIGQPCNPAEISASYDSGLQAEQDGRNGWTGMLSYYGPDLRYFDNATNPFPLKT
jgi:hypothetical protein